MRLFREKKKNVVKTNSRETPRGNNYMEQYECNLPLKDAINMRVYLNIIIVIIITIVLLLLLFTVILCCYIAIRRVSGRDQARVVSRRIRVNCFKNVNEDWGKSELLMCHF